MRCILLLLLFVAGLSFAACEPDYLSPSGYIRYIRNPEHGFIKKEAANSLSVEAFYQPPTYLALLKSKPGNIDAKQLQEEIERQSAFFQFFVSIRPTRNIPIDEQLAKVSASEDSFRIRKEHMLYRLQNCFTLETEIDSIPCHFYHVQPSGKIDNAYHFIVVFETNPLQSTPLNPTDLKLTYRDSLWVHRQFDFQFSRNSIDNSPKLKL